MMNTRVVLVQRFNGSQFSGQTASQLGVDLSAISRIMKRALKKILGLIVICLSLLCLSPAAFTEEEPAKPERISLWPGPAPEGDGNSQATNVFITVYRPAKPGGAAAVLCPGGGYGALKPGEMEGCGTAQWLNQHGIVGVVLEYRLPHGRTFVPLLDAQRAIRTVRSHAKEWGCDTNRIGIIGFSAGGHLASTVGTHFDDGNPEATDPIERIRCRPDFMVLIYPVITMGTKTHKGSKGNLLGPKPKAELIELFSNEKQVTDRTPPTFLAHAQDDSKVSPENSRMFFAALQAHKVPSKYLELPSGDHGLNGRAGPMWEAWQTQALKWLTGQGLIPQKDKPPGDH